MHIATSLELVFVRSGMIRMVTPDNLVDLKPGILLAVEPGAQHGEMYGQGSEAVFFHMQDTSVGVFRVLGHANVSSLFLLGSTSLGYVARAVSHELANRDSGFERSVHGLLEHLACILLRRLRRGSYVHLSRRGGEPESEREWAVVKAALGSLSASASDGSGVKGAARSVGYSPTHLNRFFRRYLHKTMSECLREFRIARAKDLLRNTVLPVAEISNMTGYRDPSNLRRAFKAATGYTLAQYRRDAAPSGD
jgi:AraC-like DNA-binding protein